VVREEYDEAARRADVGMLSRASLAAVENELRNVEFRARAIQLNIEEIRATAAAPRDDIAAPPVNGRDFVKERMQLEAAGAQRTMKLAEERLQEVARRRSIGAEGELAQQEAEVQVVQARSLLALLAGKLALRARVVESSVAAEQAERQLRQLELEQALMTSQRRAMFATARLAAVRDAMARGAAPRAEFLRAELDVLELSEQIRRIEAQLRAVKAP
jgi:hypothetical protein